MNIYRVFLAIYIDANVTKKVLSARSLRKVYSGRHVVRDVSIQVESGQIVGLLGPNGAGKTTCFYMIIGIIRPDQGQIFIDSEEITALPMHERAQKGLGYLAQEASVFRKLTVKENLLAFLQMREDLSRQQRDQQLEQLLDEFRLGHIVDSIGLSLSGGERRRVEIARALTTSPSFILLDEPFAGVDPISVNDINQIIRMLTDRGVGVLVTDHNVRETLAICDTAYVVSDGMILAHGDPDTILADPQVQQVYLGHEFRF